MLTPQQTKSVLTHLGAVNGLIPWIRTRVRQVHSAEFGGWYEEHDEYPCWLTLTEWMAENDVQEILNQLKNAA